MPPAAKNRPRRAGSDGPATSGALQRRQGSPGPGMLSESLFESDRGARRASGEGHVLEALQHALVHPVEAAHPPAPPPPRSHFHKASGIVQALHLRERETI